MVPHAVAVAPDVDDVTAVQQAVEQGRGGAEARHQRANGVPLDSGRAADDSGPGEMDRIGYCLSQRQNWSFVAPLS